MKDSTYAKCSICSGTDRLAKNCPVLESSENVNAKVGDDGFSSEKKALMMQIIRQVLEENRDKWISQGRSEQQMKLVGLMNNFF